MSDRILDETELREARNALKQWFISQDINPKEAGIIMVDLIAICLVDKTTDVLELQSAINTFRAGLIMSVALEVREKARR